ncbi:xanthine dehydrogenase family protein molybdopterin-binding subunit [Bordetella petrii]|uniref:Xanthine dehydrogenase family protein molybdopterin-binding subunit n=1 Tax=Bordetella petrii TaxID=94624 RepID=A0ABT7W8T4_9BORD|nr:xanthine dehydrogenase family protein molybdopterin-binding subunit [Bordetella petrii]MDM9561579.1 xanthine dehydrogenase family protein molybdopterin-binding subunit [Bordetella petrii]
MHPLVRSHAGAIAPVRNLSRRRFMQGAGGLVLGIALGPTVARAAGDAAPAASGAAFAPNAFVRIGTDGTVTVLSKHLEMGQGAYTGLATLLAEELDADWASIRVEGAPADTDLYKNLALGVQGTGGSTAIANSYEQMRRAGATARAMLVAAAAEQWQVDPQGITVSAGVVRHAASQRQAGFGELAERAARQPVPDSVPLKAPADFKLIGQEAPRRVDGAAKTDGTARFTQDMKLPGMLVAVAAHPPRFGATVAGFDASKAKAVPGVRHVVQFPGTPHSFGGVAVLADNTWAARAGRDALQVQWDDSKAYRKGTEEIRAQFRQALDQPGKVAGSKGDVDAALAQAAQVIEAEYEVPYLAHAAMEPMNCLVQLGDGRCDIWNGEQFQTVDQAAVARLLGIAPERVSITQLYAGGSFGRRANAHADYVVEAVSIAKAARDQGVRAPVKLVWTREDDMRGGYYRPLNVHRARIGLDAQGKPLAWHVRLAGQSIFLGGPFEAAMQDGIDPTSVEGQADLRYAVPNLRVESYTPEDVAVPVLWYRSVGHTHTAFSAEGLMDEAAAAARQDPVAYRLALLQDHPRHRKVLELAAERAGWSQPLAAPAQGERRGRGVALHESFNTIVAQVAEVTVKADGSFKVDRIVCALDCGVVVNPDVVRAQMEGGIGFGLSTALHGALTLKDGQVEQSNFHDYPILRINEMPAVEVHTVASTEKPTGVGEPGVPPVAPAVANALFNATGQRIRRLPFAGQLKPAGQA